MSILKKIFYIIIQCTWGIVQTLAGAVMFLVLIRRRHYFYRCCIVTEWHRGESASIGLFVFLSDRLHGERKEEVLAHEYGHTIQSLMLGVLYFPVIGIPSAVWCMVPYFERRRERKNISYYSFYPEKWANSLGKKITGIDPDL